LDGEGVGDFEAGVVGGEEVQESLEAGVHGSYGEERVWGVAVQFAERALDQSGHIFVGDFPPVIFFSEILRAEVSGEEFERRAEVWDGFAEEVVQGLCELVHFFRQLEMVLLVKKDAEHEEIFYIRSTSYWQSSGETVSKKREEKDKRREKGRGRKIEERSEEARKNCIGFRQLEMVLLVKKDAEHEEIFYIGSTSYWQSSGGSKK
jgi:hypothetical protein